jgi:hypothetical protein
MLADALPLEPFHQPDPQLKLQGASNSQNNSKNEILSDEILSDSLFCGTGV